MKEMWKYKFSKISTVTMYSTESELSLTLVHKTAFGVLIWRLHDSPRSLFLGSSSDNNLLVVASTDQKWTSGCRHSPSNIPFESRFMPHSACLEFSTYGTFWESQIFSVTYKAELRIRSSTKDHLNNDVKDGSSESVFAWEYNLVILSDRIYSNVLMLTRICSLSHIFPGYLIKRLQKPQNA